MNLPPPPADLFRPAMTLLLMLVCGAAAYTTLASLMRNRRGAAIGVGAVVTLIVITVLVGLNPPT